MVERPFCAPHHSASVASLVGGGANASPGEVSLAHNGVLFLDELPEFSRAVLEALRQPLEDGKVTVTRVRHQAIYQSSFMLIAGMNPCPCGYYGSRQRECRCSPQEIRRYLDQVSGPLLDRIDIQVEVDSVPMEEIRASAPRKAPQVAERVELARKSQQERYRGNGHSLQRPAGQRRHPEILRHDSGSGEPAAYGGGSDEPEHAGLSPGDQGGPNDR